MWAPDTLKYVFIVIAFLEAALMGLIPIKSKSFKESPMILGIANAFSGGVFVAIACLHIMPEQATAWACMQYIATDCGKDPSKSTRLPIPFLLLVAGYSFILIIDKVLFDTHAILGHDGEDHGHDEAENHGHNHGSMLRQSIAKVLS